jgi:molecular chaperone GrpE
MNKIDEEAVNSDDLITEQQEEQSNATEYTDKNAEPSKETVNIEEELKEKKKKGLFSKKKDSEVDVLKKKIEEVTLEKSEMHDRYLRLYSEFDNYRKRTTKDKLDTIKNASEEMIRVLLPVVDDFERALKNAEKIEGADAMKEGVQLIYSKLTTILRQKGLTAIESVGKPFDTDFHEAITNIPATDESQKGVVVDEVERGYLLNDKIIRYAKVVVAN